MAETSKNKIYYNDDENSVADVLADMKKMAESTDKAIENSKFNDTQIKADISNMKTEIDAKDTAQDSKILQLETEKANLEKELKEAQEDFYQASIRGKASGEYIHVEDSSNCRAKIGISGNSEQETRSGKNYLNTLAKYKAGEKVTIEGITYTFNEDGSITCNGTATANSILDISADIQTINGTNKRMVGLLTGSQVPANIKLTAFTSNWGKNPVLTLSEVNKSLTANMIENAEYTIFRIVVYSGTIVNNQTIYYQILDASETDLTYEQYGTMPSLDYPSEIKTVGDNVNKLANLIQTQNINGVEIIRNDDESLTFNGTATDGISINLNNEQGKYFNAVKGVSYTISLKNNNGLYFRLRKVSENVNIASFDSPKTDNTFVSNYTGECFAYLVILKGTTFNNLTIYPKLEKGIVATPWSPHGQGSIKVTKCNKNILKNDLINQTKNGIKVIHNEDDSLTVEGTSTAITDIRINGDWYNKNKILTLKKGKQYGILGTSSRSDGYYIIVNGLNHKIILRSTTNNSDSSIITTEDTDIYDIYLHIEKDVTVKNIIYPMITEGIPNKYEQHQEQSYIMPVQQEMLEEDYFDFDNEEEVHVWKKYVFAGEENIRTTINGNSFALDLTDILSDTNQEDIPLLMSNTYKTTTWVNRNGWNEKYTISQFSKVIGFDKGNFTTVEEFKAWLKSLYDAGTPVIVYYKLQTPTRLKFTDEQKSVAKELSNARTYKNVTNITTDSKAVLDLDYVKDLETLITSNQKVEEV